MCECKLQCIYGGENRKRDIKNKMHCKTEKENNKRVDIKRQKENS